MRGKSDRNDYALPQPDPLILDIGCGKEKQVEEAIGIDIVKTDATDVIFNVDKEGIPYPDDSVDEIYARMVFEHVDADYLITESRRVLKPGGSLHLTLPHPFTTGFWQDWTHTIQPGFTVDGIQYLSSNHEMFYEHNMGPWDIEDIDVAFWLNSENLVGRACSAMASTIAQFGSPRVREELLKLPFTGGWLEAELLKPEEQSSKQER